MPDASDFCLLNTSKIRKPFDMYNLIDFYIVSVLQ